MTQTQPRSVSGTGHRMLQELFALDATEIGALPWVPIADRPGVFDKILWHLGDFTVALIRFEPGASSEGTPMLAAHEHLWVVTGTATIGGRRMTAGSYMHVPPGMRHPVEDVGADGLTLLQMHRPHAPVEAEILADADDALEDPNAMPGEGVGSAAAAALAAARAEVGSTHIARTPEA